MSRARCPPYCLVPRSSALFIESQTGLARSTTPPRLTTLSGEVLLLSTPKASGDEARCSSEFLPDGDVRSTDGNLLPAGKSTLDGAGLAGAAGARARPSASAGSTQAFPCEVVSAAVAARRGPCLAAVSFTSFFSAALRSGSEPAPRTSTSRLELMWWPAFGL